MDSRQFDVIIGISRKMEESLSKIEKNLSASSNAGSPKMSNALGGLAGTLNAVLMSFSSKKFDPKKANSILEFSRGLVEVANSAKISSVKGFAEFSDGISKSFDTLLDVMNPVRMIKLYLASKVLFEGKEPLLKRIISGMTNAFQGLDTAAAKEGSEAIKILGEGLISLTKALKGFILIGLAAPVIALGALVVKSVISLFSSFGKHAKSIREGGDALKSLGKGLIAFSAGLATVLLVTIVATPERILGAISVLALFGLTFWALGKASDSISKGARSVALMGLAMFGFSAALATFMLVMLIVKPAAILMGLAVIASFGVVFALMGIDSVARQIAQGALLLIGMSFSLAFFGLGLLVFGAAVKIFEYDDLFMGALLIAEIGLAMALLGKFAKKISAGALVMAEMGVGLAFFGVGAAVFGLAIKLFDMESIAVGAALIAGLGIAFAIVGYAAPYVTAGALVVGEMGIALFAFSAGILAFGVSMKLLQLIFDDLAEAGMIAGGIIIGLGIAFAIIGAASPFIIPGAVAMIAMGVSLIAISVGVIAFALAIKALQSMFDNLEEAGRIAGGVLVGLGLAFTIIGIAAIPIVLGAAAVATMGISLLLFSAGLMVFALATKAVMNMFDDDLDAVGGKMRSFFMSMGLAFAGVGLLSLAIIPGSIAILTMGSSLAIFGGGLLMFGYTLSYLEDKGLLVENSDGETVLKGLGVLTGIAASIAGIGIYALNPFFWTGVTTSIGLGASLLIIGSGLLVAAKALNEVQDMDSLVSNLFGDGGLINTMADQFARIGDKYGGGLLSSFLGTDPVSMGIRAVRGFGDVLKDLAGGIVAFSNFSEFPVEVPDPKNPSKLIYRAVDVFADVIPAINENLPKLLSILATTFGDIGIRFGGEGGWFGDDSPVQKGVSAVKGLGGVLSEIAGGIVAFSRFDEFPVQIPDPKDPSKLIYKSINLFEALPKIKTALVGDGNLQGKLTSKSGILLSLAEVFGEIGNKYGDGFFTDGSVKKGIEAVQGIGKVVSELAQGIIAFASMQRGLPNYDKDGKFNGTYTPFSLVTVKNNIISVLNVLPEIFATVDIEKMEMARKKARAAIPLAESISKIGEAMQSLLVDKGSGEKESLVGIIGSGIKQMIDDTEKLKLNSETTKSLQNFYKVLKNFADLSDPFKELSTSLSSTGSALSTQIEKIEKFKVSSENTENLRKFYDALKNLSSLDAPLNSLGVSIEKISNFSTSLKDFSSLGSPLNSLADSLSKIGGSYSSLKDLSTLSSPLNSLADSLSKIGISLSSLKDLSSLNTPLNTLTSSMEKMGSFFSVLKELSELSSPLNLLADSLSNVGNSLATQIEKLEKFQKLSILKMSEDTISQFHSFYEILKDLSSLGDPLTKLANSLSSTGSGFSVLSTGFSKFTSQLERFERFEKAFSSLSQNAYNYKFDKFAASMGTLKKNVNDFNVENLKLTDSLMKSLAVLSKHTDVGDKIKDSIDEAMKQLVEVIEEISKNTSSQASAIDKFASFNFNAPTSAPVYASPVIAKTPVQDSQSAANSSNQAMMTKLDRLANAVESLANKLQVGDQGALKVFDINRI